MKGREQKTSKDTWQQKDRAEPERYAAGQTFMRIIENNLTNVNLLEDGLLEQILSPSNLNQAYKRVRSNKGKGGVDKMEVDALKVYLVENRDELLQSIRDGKYRPNPVRRVEIPKANGKKRSLGIPTVVDRVFQQAITQVLSPIYEKQFSAHSYGFRPNKNAHQALKKCRDYITNGYTYSVDMDLQCFFDTVNHSKLVEVLSRTTKDGRVISLIHKYLRAGVVNGNKFEETKLGVPQGSPLSPLLSNVLLNELDKELQKRGHRFVRYADDLIILCKSKRGAERTLRNIIPFIENKLFLKVNKEKTQVTYIRKTKFLGYSFYQYKGEGRLRAHPDSIHKMKQHIKLLTSRSNGGGGAIRKGKLNQFIKGWVNYFKMADMKNLLRDIDMWYRRRLRMCIWKQWKHIRTKGRMLIKLGLSKNQAWQYANTRKNYWRIANTDILRWTITNKRLSKAGYPSLLEFYMKVRT
ncbi:group II intron reverse transcriptase/maturase [Flagellimonas halotolerans]|uniref:RNA-directed DNA polymerase n=1 Tax=Flagellimonas halotolerans TaxID=3112164 RepID=A0ABU6INY3_9FLAO|nr:MULTISPECIES: group II intron reverse transcriptase/maturase [unclassified Allomuricauda]MEC3964819.1 group II intron reverse transcriptase/maturase [Muricauda sp. SYSU M86414]MEC4264817.1 group II intron reverse transcriptase/maturase [Muricauda sp. SYSU M84420]